MEDGRNLCDQLLARHVVSEDAVVLSEPLLNAGNEETGIRLVVADANDVRKKERLASLDVFRGITIAVMILVDDAGGAWPAINHSPWNGVTLADFVMPAFLFIVGMATSQAYKRVPCKRAATSKALSRTFKLWLWGIALQGGYVHGLGDLSYGLDVSVVRWCGILQRIGLAYLVVSLCEIWNPSVSTESLPEGSESIIQMYFWHWVVAGLLSTIYLVLLYGLYVPDWEFVPFSIQPSVVLKVPGSEFVASPIEPPVVLTVKCGTRGNLSPPCNAVGYLDRLLLGIDHLYKNPMYKRTKDCSISSPDYGPMPPGAPDWCLAPFDPEGVLSSVAAISSCFIGLHYGHVLVHLKSHTSRVMHWTLPSLGMLLLGITLHYLGVPLNKPLYSLSYVFLTAGASGLLFVAMYLLVDVYGIRWPTLLLEWMGMNSLLLFVLAASEIAFVAIQGFYWGTPENDLIHFVVVQCFGALFHSKSVAKVAFVLFEILFWSLVTWACHLNGFYWKL